MKIQIPPFKEKRQFGRIKIPESTICQVYVPHSRKTIRGYRGLIQNISLGGIYFVCDENPPLEKDDIRHIVFDVIYNYNKIYRLIFHSLVVRTESEASKFAVALKLLSDPIYYSLKVIKDGELPFLDNVRIMYQNYDLYRKAYKTINETKEIRHNKIKEIKKSIDQGLYKIEYGQLALSITDNLTGIFHNFAEEFYKRILK
jgi:Anti-sigma-28 factor, FlgM/PilZ domain